MQKKRMGENCVRVLQGTDNMPRAGGGDNTLVSISHSFLQNKKWRLTATKPNCRRFHVFSLVLDELRRTRNKAPPATTRLFFVLKNP